MIRPGALGAVFLVFAGTVLPAAAEEVRPAKPEITWSVMHPTAIDVAYMKRVVEKAKEYGGVGSFEACGDCHSPYGGINGLSMLEPYPHARAKIDPRKVEKARADLNAICELAHSIGKPLYYWHREVFLAKGLLEDRPEMLDENGEFDLLGKAYQDYLRFKIREAFRHCPKLDGVVLTLTEADYSVIHSAHPEKYPPQRVVEALVGLFAEEHERAGKRFILRSFGSNSRDYADIIGGARRAAAKHAFEIETKVTEADFVPWLPKNPFLRKSEPLRLGVECDALGEYLGAGYLPAAQVDRIREYVGYGREEGADRYVIRIDRVGNSIFDSAHEVNLYAYMRFIADPSVRSDQVVAEYAARRFGDAAREMAPIMKGELEMVRNIHYIASNLTFHSFPLKPDMKWLKAGGIYSVYRENADLSGTKDIWSILSWMRTPSHAQILAEKDAGFALATNALASVERLKGRMPADEYERQHRAFATAVLAARALRAYTRCVVAYFEDMADRRDEPVRLNRAADAAVAEIESMMTDVGDTFTGEGSYFATAGGNLDRVYFVGLRFYCRELVREYRLERAMRRKLERPDVYDFVIPGGIYDDNRTIRTMHGAHASAGSDRVVRYAGNDVFPNGTITVRLNAPKDARITVETDPAGASDYSLSKAWSNGVWTVVIGKKGPGYPGVLSIAAALSWPEPTSTMKPWVYNWWMANAVDEAGLEYQCKELEAKGFGGFHVIPIYGAKGYEKQWRTLLSPEWVEAWNMAAETAARHGLGIDLTMGSGWCFGGPWVTAEDAASSGVRVKRPCPGGEGPMIDPFSPKAMSNHVARFEALFGKGGTARRPRAFYNDSYENDGARPKDGRDPVESQIACFKVWTDWCRRNGYISRNEAHGAPTNWLDLYALADIPETEMFGSGVGRDILVSKFASSAAHVTGRRLVAAEGCTWIDEHFCERPGDIKVEVDELFLAGVNHFFFHGLCYSPVGAAWPGWCFYASTQMNPRNPIWREIGALTAYITRCQSVFQTWTCDNDLLVLFDPKYTGEQMCIDDASRWFYSADGIGNRARELFEAGYQFDYVSPRMIAANPSLTNRLDVARARKSPFGGLDGVCSLRFRKGDETLYFVVTRKHPLEIAAERPFAVMDPMTGEIGGRSAWRLEKGASCFIRSDGAIEAALGRGDETSPSRKCTDSWGGAVSAAQIDIKPQGWSVEAVCGGPTLPSATNITRLVSWTAWDESFSGTMRYSCTFDAPRNAGAIDLGDVREIVRVRVNGRDLGCRFMAPYRFPLPDGLLGERGNRLEVEVTNLGGNRLRWCDRNGVKWKYFTNINMVGLDYKPLDAGRWKVLPSGLLGPVCLTTAFAAVDVESEEPVVRHGAAKLREFLARTYPSGGESPWKVTVAVAAEKNPLTSRITVTDDGVRVTGATPREALQGCYRLMDELEAGDRPVLRKGTRTYTRMFSPRMVHSGYEIEKYTDAHMDEIARAGLDAILVYVNDPPDGTRNGREDFPALVKRAAEHGLDVYAYADFFWNPILVNPCDPGAEEKYEAVFGAIAKNAPGLKGIVCVGESCYFPERGEPPLKPGAERPDRHNGWTPTLDWAEFLRLVTKVTRKYSPGFDVVFWTYNWYGKPEKDRLALLEAIPTNVTVHVTFEMGNPACEKDGVTFHVDDYSITESGPGTTFVSEAEVCGRRGIPLTSMSNTGGRTWDFGGMPFEPAPYAWLERFRKLREARDRWGLKGLMDSHHYGFVPNVVADLAKAAFTCETAEGDFEPALRALAVREVGSAAADDLLATWRDWSDAFKWHSARGYDQYGPLRLGSSYPLLRPDEPFPPSPRPVYEYVNGKRNGNGWLYLNGRYSCPGKDLDGRIRTDGRELELLGRGNARLEAALGKVPSGKAASARRMLGYGKYMEAAVRTLRNVRRYRKACREGDEAERRRILGEEEANVRGLLPWVEADPRLGFEPSMRYVTDPFMLKWKLDQLKSAY